MIYLKRLSPIYLSSRNHESKSPCLMQDVLSGGHALQLQLLYDLLVSCVKRSVPTLGTNALRDGSPGEHL